MRPRSSIDRNRRRRYRRRRDEHERSGGWRLGDRGDRRRRHDVRPDRRDGRCGTLPRTRSAGRELPPVGPRVRAQRLRKGRCPTRGTRRSRRGDRARCGDRRRDLPGRLLVRHDGSSRRFRARDDPGREERIPDVDEEHGLRRLSSDGTTFDPDVARRNRIIRFVRGGLGAADRVRSGRRADVGAGEGAPPRTPHQVPRRLDGPRRGRGASPEGSRAPEGYRAQRGRDRQGLVQSEGIYARPFRHGSA